MRIIVLIYTCRKRLPQARLLYAQVVNKVPDVYLVYGDPSLQDLYKLEGHDLVLRCNDDYTSLSFKTRRMLQVVTRLWPGMTGMIKCDDDIVWSTYHWLEIQQLLEKENPAYLGRQCLQRKLITKFSRHHEDIRDLDFEYDLPVCTFAAGPMYYLGIEAVRCLQKTMEFCFHEDIMVARHLAAYNMNLRSYPLYINTSSYDPFHIVENAQGKMKNLYLHLHGGLGNLLFQVVGGLFNAQKLKMNLVLVRGRRETSLYTHFDIDDMLSTILFFFNTIEEDDVPDSRLVNLNRKCFEKVWIEHNGATEPLQIKGYFQNLGYLEDLEQPDILNRLFLYNTAWKDDLLARYPRLPSRYFLHIRRGDYVEKWSHVYSLLSESDYYPRAIRYILDRDPDAFFYIISDDTAWCRRHFIEPDGRYTSLLPAYQKEIIELDEFRTLYFMALCGKGAICANSTFSWWGSHLQSNPDKVVIFPNEWIHPSPSTLHLYPKNAIRISSRTCSEPEKPRHPATPQDSL